MANQDANDTINGYLDYTNFHSGFQAQNLVVLSTHIHWQEVGLDPSENHWATVVGLLNLEEIRGILVS